MKLDVSWEVPITVTSRLQGKDADHEGAFVCNVVVEVGWRGKGCGTELMKAAAEHSVKHWEAKRLYAHVAADNEVCRILQGPFSTHDQVILTTMSRTS